MSVSSHIYARRQRVADSSQAERPRHADEHGQVRKIPMNETSASSARKVLIEKSV